MENLTTVKKSLASETNSIVFISSETCSICHVDAPKAKALAESYKIPFHHLDIVQDPELSGFFEVYHNGKEVARQARFIDFKSLEKLLQQLPEETEAIDYQELFK